MVSVKIVSFSAKTAVYCCSSCKYVYFFGKESQLRSWINRKTICTSTATLHDQHKKKTYKSGSYPTNLTPKEKNKVAELISDKCLIQCKLNKREALVLLYFFEKAFDNSDIRKIESFVNLIQSQEQEKVVVKIKGKDCIISPSRIVQVACKTKVGCFTSPQPMRFQQGEVELPEGLECTDSVIMLIPGAKNYFQFPVSNSSNHGIVLKKNTIV